MSRIDSAREIEVGQVYEDDRSPFSDAHVQVVYVDDRAVLMRYPDGEHRLEKRQYFRDMLSTGRLSYESTQELGTFGINEDWTEVSGIGEKAAQNLRDADIKSKGDVCCLVLEDLTDISGIGKKNGRNLQEYSR